MYNDHILFDGEICELVWSDSDSGVKIEGRTVRKAQPSGGGGILDMLTGMSKQKTADMVSEKRNAMKEPEPAVVESE